MREFKFRCWQNDILGKGWHMINSLGKWQVEELSPPDPEEEVVMQYTGLKDKNGVEIYEGDIVRHKNAYSNIIDVVKWWSNSARFNIDSKYLDEQEVIGNIYENPELLDSVKAAS